MVQYSDEVAETNEAFYTEFGRAMASWSNVEAGLGVWFQIVTKIEPNTASAIYHSARSFGGRVEMLTAASAHSKQSEPLKAFLKAAMKKAIAYNAFRNTLAHHRVVFRVPGGMVSAPGDDLINGVSYGRRHLVCAATNFRALHLILSTVSIHPREMGISPQQGLAEVLRLPNHAHSSEPNPTPEPRKPRRKPLPE